MYLWNHLVVKIVHPFPTYERLTFHKEKYSVKGCRLEKINEFFVEISMYHLFYDPYGRRFFSIISICIRFS